MAEEEDIIEEEVLEEEVLEEEVLEEEVLEEEEELEEGKSASQKCPECPAMAPAWMATFADMATLLMAFFVLILSFVEMEDPSIFKEVSGSMSNAFGVQREVPSVEPPMGTNIIAQNFKTSKVNPSLIVNVQEDTTDAEPTEEELKTTTLSGDFDTNEDIEILKKALATEISMGMVEIRVQDESIVIVTNEKNQAPAIDSNEIEPVTGGVISDNLLQLYAKVAEAQSQLESEVFVGSDEASNDDQEQQDREREQLIDEKLERVRANLKSEIAQGKANVERIGDQILVQLSAQDSFRSGFAELRSDFLPTLSAMSRTIADLNSKVTVSGHTDNIPIAFSERFLSNWDLSAARAAAVADYLLGQNAVTEERIDVVGYADTKPVASNSTQAGRSQNRRIELLIDG